MITYTQWAIRVMKTGEYLWHDPFGNPHFATLCKRVLQDTKPAMDWIAHHYKEKYGTMEAVEIEVTMRVVE